MKNSKSALLILSALAAMTLASCGEPTKPSSSAAVNPGSSLAPGDSSSSAEASGSIAASSSPSGNTSSAGPSSSLPSSSSQPIVETDWVGKAFVGQYQGGFTTLIINEDKSTSWDTDNTHYPAKVEDLGNGVFHITSEESVASEEKVDIYTDGTMAYVVHDAQEKDAFIVDKGAEYQAANTLAKKADGSLLIGSIEVGGKAKYFRAVNGAFAFNVKVEMGYGTSIEAAGSIFTVTSGGSSLTYRTITAGNSASGLAAVIEDYQIVETIYHGEAGDLLIARNNGEIVYVTLDGVSVSPELVVEEAGAITIKGENRTLDDSDPNNIVWVYSAVKYTLNDAAHTYVAADATSREGVFHALDMSLSQYTATVGEDGNLWATFTPSVGGLFSCNVISGTGENDDYYYYDTTYDVIAIYRADATQYGSPTVYAETYAYWDYSYYSGVTQAAITDFQLEAGVTYIIKAGDDTDIYNVLGDNGSLNEGADITIGYSFTAFQTETYNGDQGTLSIETLNGAFRGASLNGQGLGTATKTGNVITAVTSVYDFQTDPTDPKKITTTVTITINPDDNTYVLETNVESASIFHGMTDADSGTTYSTVVGADGNLWVAFTPSANGYLTVNEVTSSTNGGDGYLAIFDSSAAAFTDSYGNMNSLEKSDKTSGNLEEIINFRVTAGHTYIIKAGAYADRGRDIGDTGSTFAGATEAISITFSALLTQVFTGANGDLALSTENGEYRGATIGNVEIPNGELVDNNDGTLTLSSMGNGTVDNTDRLDPTRTSTDVVYTLDTVAMTYASASSTVTRHIFEEITSTPITISKTVADDGNLWAKFTAPASGYLSVEELAHTANDSVVAVYPANASAFTYTVSNKNNTVPGGAADASTSALEKLTNVLLNAGETYIIKAGAYGDASKEVTATGSTNKGKFESIRVTFDAFDAETYTGASGDLIINKAGEQVVSITLAGAPLDKAMLDEDGNVFVAGTATVDNTDPLAPTKSSTDTVYELDKTNNTYVVNSKNVNKPIFHEVTGTSVVTDYVEKDGNLWIEFTAPSDGEISVDELVASTTDNYIQIFESTTAGNFAASNAKATADFGGTASGGGKINDFVVQGGKTYIIKAGHYYDKDKDVTGTSAKPIALESVSFTWNAYATDVYTSGDGADLTISKKGDTILSVKLGEETLNGAVLNEDGNIVVGLGLAAGEDGNYYDAYYVYVLNDEDHTYALEKLSIPYAPSESFTVTPVVGDYGFTEDAGTYTSNNGGQHSSDAKMTIAIEEDGIISFDYDVSSEGTSTIWDYLEISVNGQVVDGYAKIGGEAGKSGKFLLEVSAGDVVTLKYHKDSSGNGGRDNAIISNIVLLVVPAESGQE